MPAFNYSSTAGEMTLVGDISSSATVIAVSSVTGLPVVPFKLVLDPGQSTEEIVKVTAASGTSLTVTRGWDGTSGQAHSALAKIRHMMTAEDLRLSRQHEDLTSAHGVAGAVVGTTDTQVLTNKDLTGATNSFPTTLARSADLTAHTDATAAHGATGAVVGTTNTQTLTDKTLDGASNTFSNIPQAAVTGVTTMQSDVNTAKTDITNNKARLTALEAPTWTALTTWSASVSGDTTMVPQYHSDNGRVDLRGVVNHATAFSGNAFNVGTLPAGARPNVERNFAIARQWTTGDSAARLRIATTGVMTYYSATNDAAWISLDGIYFFTA